MKKIFEIIMLLSFFPILTIAQDIYKINNYHRRPIGLYDIFCTQNINDSLIKKMHIRRAHLVNDNFNYHIYISFDTLGRLTESNLCRFDERSYSIGADSIKHYLKVTPHIITYHYTNKSRIPKYVIENLNNNIDTLKIDTLTTRNCFPSTKKKEKDNYQVLIHSYYDNGLIKTTYKYLRTCIFFRRLYATLIYYYEYY